MFHLILRIFFQDSRILFQDSRILFKIQEFLPRFKDFFQDSRTCSRFKDFFQNSRTSSKIQGSSSRAQGLLPRFKDFFKIRGLLQDSRISSKIQGFPRFKDFQDSRTSKIQGLLPRFKGLLPGLKDYFQDSRTSSKFEDFFKIQGLLPRFKDFFQDSRTSRFKDFFQDSRVFFQDSGPGKVANVSKIQIPKKKLQMFNLLPFYSSKHNPFFCLRMWRKKWSERAPNLHTLGNLGTALTPHPKNVGISILPAPTSPNHVAEAGAQVSSP